MTAMMALPLLVALVVFYAALALADNVTFDVVNTTNHTIFPRTVGGGSGDPTMDFAAILPKGSARLSFERDSRFALFFAPNCSRDELGRLIDCSSGNCPKEGCTPVDKPVATMIYYDKGTVTASGPFGYNFALRAEFLNGDPDMCPPVSCNVTIKARDKAPYCRGSAATSCFDGAILMVTVS